MSEAERQLGELLEAIKPFQRCVHGAGGTMPIKDAQMITAVPMAPGIRVWHLKALVATADRILAERSPPTGDPR